MSTEDQGGAAGTGADDLPDAVVDARFAELVADWGQAVDETPSTPAASADGAGPGEPTPDGGHAGRPPVAPPTSLVFDIPVWRGPTGPSTLDETEATDDEGYTPGPVDLPPGEDLHYWGAVAGLVIGPLLVLYVAIARPFYATWWLLGGIGLFVTGFVLLVLRAPVRRDPDDTDTGARV